MPVTTPEQGKTGKYVWPRFVEVVLDGDTFDDAFTRAKDFVNRLMQLYSAL